MANILIGEILKEVNEDINLLMTKHKASTLLRNVLEHGFLPEKKFLLPEGVPEFKSQLGPAEQHEQAFNMEARKFYVYCRQDLKPIKREHMFLHCLESLSATEASIFIAIKEQNIDSLYPNITFENLREIGYLV